MEHIPGSPVRIIQQYSCIQMICISVFAAVEIILDLFLPAAVQAVSLYGTHHSDGL